jgi:glycosyltransferase involved in cell wall biosynthesis
LPDGPIVGFFGLISEWVDQDLLIALARALRAPTPDTRHPTPSLVLIGKADVDVSRLKAELNIHLLGPKPFAELPRYVAFFDVGIIPFAVNELTRAVNPIKLREMLAAGCRVVSTDLPEVERYITGDDAQGTAMEAVRIGRDEHDFVRQVGAWLCSPLLQDRRAAISRSMGAEGWDKKVREIVELVGK